MANSDDYQIKYWSDLENFSYHSPKPERSIKRKLTIVISFLLILAITPSVIYSLTNLDLSPKKEVSVASTQNKPISENSEKTQPEIHTVTVELPKKSSNQAEVINNDSYWKISKRVCGNGKYYISIQSQNGGKALYKGDFVSASCVL
jgi:hypothetical protein